MTDTSTYARRLSAAELQFNPFARECLQLTEQMAALRPKRAPLLAAITWYDGFDMGKVENERMVNMIRRVAYDVMIAQLDTQLVAVATTRDEAGRAAMSHNLLSCLVGKGRRHWKAHEQAASEHEALLARRVELDASREPHEARLAEIARDLEIHARFDRAAVSSEVARIEQEMLALNDSLQQATAQRDRIAQALAFNVDNLARAEAQLDAIEQAEARAGQFDAELTAQTSPAMRRQIHEACGRELGHDRPSAVIRECHGRRAKLERDRAKLVERLRVDAAWAAMTIRRIVIDGSNLCFVDGQPIGLGALEALVACLAPRYEVIVVFDGHVHRKLGMTRRQMLDRLESLATVRPVRGSADETVLELAASPDAFVISNDGYQEFQDRNAVAGKRVIQHEIVHDRVLVHALRVNAGFVREQAAPATAVAASPG